MISIFEMWSLACGWIQSSREQKGRLSSINSIPLPLLDSEIYGEEAIKVIIDFYREIPQTQNAYADEYAVCRGKMQENNR